MDSHRTVLIAGLIPLMQEVQRVLAADFVTISAETLQEAQRLLHEERPDCVVVAYHFDEIQPFRLISYIRQDRAFDGVAIILVRVLRFNLGATQEQVGHAYQGLGADRFFDLHEEAQRLGMEVALADFAARVRESCWPGQNDQSHSVPTY